MEHITSCLLRRFGTWLQNVPVWQTPIAVGVETIGWISLITVSVETGPNSTLNPVNILPLSFLQSSSSSVISPREHLSAFIFKSCHLSSIGFGSVLGLGRSNLCCSFQQLLRKTWLLLWLMSLIGHVLVRYLWMRWFSWRQMILFTGSDYYSWNFFDNHAAVMNCCVQGIMLNLCETHWGLWLQHSTKVKSCRRHNHEL